MPKQGRGRRRSTIYFSGRWERYWRGSGSPLRTFSDGWRGAAVRYTSDCTEPIGGEEAVRYVLFRTVGVLLEGNRGPLHAIAWEGNMP